MMDGQTCRGTSKLIVWGWKLDIEFMIKSDSKVMRNFGGFQTLLVEWKIVQIINNGLSNKRYNCECFIKSSSS
jgi:hypothetical protein